MEKRTILFWVFAIIQIWGTITFAHQLGATITHYSSVLNLLYFILPTIGIEYLIYSKR